MSTTQMTDQQHFSNRLLVFGLLSGPLVYSVYFWVGYLFAEATCTVDQLNFQIRQIEAVSLGIALLTAVAALLTGGMMILGLRTWWRTRADDDAWRAERSYVPFMAFVGAWLNGLFTLFILLTGIAPFFLVLCDWI